MLKRAVEIYEKDGEAFPSLKAHTYGLYGQALGKLRRMKAAGKMYALARSMEEGDYRATPTI